MGHPTMQENDTAKLTPTDFRLNDIWLMNRIVFSSFYYCISLVCFDLSLSLFGIRL